MNKYSGCFLFHATMMNEKLFLRFHSAEFNFGLLTHNTYKLISLHIYKIKSQTNLMSLSNLTFKERMLLSLTICINGVMLYIPIN